MSITKLQPFNLDSTGDYTFANVAASNISIGANLSISSSTIKIGNNTVNTTITAGNIALQGTSLTVGNVNILGTSISVGNSTVNTTFTPSGLTFPDATIQTSASSIPRVSIISYPGDDLAADTAGTSTITLVGSGFVTGCTVFVGASQASVVTFISSSSITFTAPAKTAATFPLYIVNPDGGTATVVPGISYSGTPAWSTTAGTLGTLNEASSVSNTVSATGDAPVTYSVYSGTLPPGSTLNGNTGVISGTSPVIEGSTTYNFVIRATDVEKQDSDRSFSITINPDVVAMTLPSNNSTTTTYEYAAISNVTMEATSNVGKAITFTSNTLPANLTLSGTTISGTPTTVGNTTVLITGTANTTNKTATTVVNFVVNPDTVTWSLPANNSVTTTYEYAAISNVTMAATSAAGRAVAFSSNTLPANLTLSGTTISGTPTTVGNTVVLITGTANTTNRTATEVINFVVQQDAVSWSSPANNSTTTTYEYAAISNVTMAATSAAGMTVTYTSNTLPANLTLSGTTISGTPTTPGNTVVLITGTANTTNRTATEVINFVVQQDAVTWSSPANNSTTTAYEYVAISNVTMSATSAAGRTVTYTSNTLPANVTLSGTTISGTPTTVGNTVVLITGTANTTNRTATEVINFVVQQDAVTWSTANNSTTNLTTSSAASVDLLATSAAGKSITYTANSLPTGLTIVGAAVTGTPTTAGNTSSLITATAATTNRTAVRTFNWSVSVTGDTYIKNTTLLLSGGTSTPSFIADASVNSFPLTIAGDTKPNNFNPYTPGYYSNYFDGTGDYLTVPSSTAFGFGTGDFTVEGWLYLLAGGAYGGTNIIDFRTTESGAPWTIFVKNTGGGTYVGSYTSFGSTGIEAPSGLISLNTWTHVAITRSSGTWRIFINGINQTLTGSGYEGNLGSTNNVTIAATVGGSGFLTCYLSNLRLVKGTAVYTTAFTPPSAPLTAIANTSLLTCQSNRFIDNSTNAYTITKAGDVAIKSFSPFTPNSSYSTYGSGYFDGTGDYLNVATNAVFNFGTGDFTLEAWIYRTASGSDAFIMSASGSGGLFLGIPANGDLGWGRAAVAWDYQFASGMVINRWYHVALTRSGTSMKMFVDGTQLGVTQNIATSYDISTTALNIGSQGANLYFTGYISNARVVKGVAVYTTTFTPPTSPLTAISGTSLLTLQNNQPANNNVFLDNSTNNFLVTRNGNATQGTFSPYGGNWSNYFSASQVYSALSPASTKFNLIGDFTLEAYVFATVRVGGTWGILDARVSGATAAAWVFGIDGNGKLTFYDGSAKNGATTITLNTWHHVAWVRNGSVLRGYLDGVLDYYNGAYGSSAVSPGSTAPYVGTKDYAINSDYGTPGYLSDLRVVIGTAVYTTSSTTVGATIFTPSTTPLTAVTNTVVLTCQSQRFVDNSLNNFTVTPSSTTISVQRFSPFNPSSVTPTSYSGYFNNTDLSITSGASASSFGASANFTIETWVMWPAAADGNQTYIELVGVARLIIGRTTTGFRLYNDGIVQNFTYTFSPGVWYHIAMVRVSGTNSVYINGVLANTPYTNSTNWSFTTIAIGRNSDLAEPMTGYVSNLRIVNGTAVYTGAFTVPTTPLQATQSSGTNIAAITGTATSLLTCQSTAFIDNSTNNFTITATGNSQPRQQNPFGYTSATTNGYTVSTIGGSGYFEGGSSTGYLALTQAASNIIFPSVNSGGFTIEFWFFPAATSSTFNTVIAGAWTSVGVVWWEINCNSTGFNLTLGNNGFGYSSGNITSSTPFIANQWAHVVVQRRTNGTNWDVFQNGVNVSANQTSPNNFNLYSPAPIRIAYGYGNGSLSNLTAFYLTDFKITNSQVYTASFVPPAAPLTAVQNTVLLTNMTGAGIYDSASMNDIETIGDAKIVSTETPYAGAYYSNLFGTGINIQAPNNAALVFGTGDFTVEMWINPTTWGASSDQLISGAGSNALQISKYGGNSYLGVAAQGTAWIITDAALPTTGVWTHVAVTRSGTSLKVFINGIQSGSTATNSTSFTVTNGIGADITTNTYNFNGYISNVRMIKGTAVYTATFTPPTAPLTATQAAVTLAAPTTVEYLVVAGGGGGGSNWGGGGGAGGFRTASGFAVTSGTPITVTIGAGGNGGVYPSTAAAAGSPSLFSTITSVGGGYGGGGANSNSDPGGAGGSGGGGHQGGAGGAGTVGQGFEGGAESGGIGTVGAGGGGAGAAALDIASPAAGGGGGIGLVSTMSGASIYYAGGGGGGGYTGYAGGAGGAGGGGAGATGSNGTGTAGTVNTGGGGGGNAGGGGGAGGAGGSGIVIIRYADTLAMATCTGSPTITVAGGYKIYKFLSSGTITFNTETVAAIASGTSLLTCQSNKFVDNSTNAFALTLTGSPAIKSFNPFRRNSATTMYFDGTGDYLTSTLSALGSGDFTIEYWIYPTADVNQYIFVLGTNWGDGTGVQIINYSGQLSMQVGSASSIALLANPAINTWYHHAVVRSGSSVKFYVNGVASAVTLTTSTDLTATAFKLGHGTAGSWASFIGYMSDLRITKGVARYTTTFTPPTTAHLIS